MGSTLNKNLDVQLLVWEFKDALYGVDISNCIESKADVEIFPIPFSKPYIAGIANLRGEISVVYDLGILLGQKKRAFQNKETIVRLSTNSNSYSIIVDSITEIIQESLNNLKPATSYLSRERCEYISHVLDNELGLIQILNLEKIYIA